MVRHLAFAIVVLLCASPTAVAESSGVDEATGPVRTELKLFRVDPASEKKIEGPYVVETRVFFRKEAGEWRFFDHQAPPRGKGELSLRYVSSNAKHLDVHIDIHPGGLLPQDYAIAWGGRGVLDEIQAAEHRGTFKVVKQPKVSSYVIDRPPREPLTLLRYDFEYKMDGERYVSVMALIFRGLFFQRLSVTAHRRDANAIEPTIETLVKDLMMPIRIVNRGSCIGTMNINGVDELPEGAEAVSVDGLDAKFLNSDPAEKQTETINRAISRRLDIGCYPFDEDPASPQRGEEGISLSYAPGFWHEKPEPGTPTQDAN